MLIVSVLAILAQYLTALQRSLYFFIKTHLTFHFCSSKYKESVKNCDMAFFGLEIINGKNGQRANRDEITEHSTCSSNNPASSEFVSFSANNFLIRSCLWESRAQSEEDKNPLSPTLHPVQFVHTHTLHWSPVWAAVFGLSPQQCGPAAGCGGSGVRRPFPALWSWPGGCPDEASAKVPEEKINYSTRW